MKVIKTEIPASCWDVPFFKECHTEAGHKAFRYCQTHQNKFAPDGDWSKSLYNNFSNCREDQFEKNISNCVSDFSCPKSSPPQKTVRSISLPDELKTLPFGKFSADTKFYQSEANRILAELNQPLITVDGILGAGTCAAFKTVLNSGKISNWVMPLKCNRSSASPSPQPLLPEDGRQTQTFKSASTSRKSFAVAAGSFLAVISAYLIYSELNK
jgi:hypothetical protein